MGVREVWSFGDLKGAKYMVCQHHSAELGFLVLVLSGCDVQSLIL